MFHARGVIKIPYNTQSWRVIRVLLKKIDLRIEDVPQRFKRDLKNKITRNCLVLRRVHMRN